MLANKELEQMALKWRKSGYQRCSAGIFWFGSLWVVQRNAEAIRLEVVEFDRPEVFSFFEIVGDFFFSHAFCVPQLFN